MLFQPIEKLEVRGGGVMSLTIHNKKRYHFKVLLNGMSFTPSGDILTPCYPLPPINVLR